MQALSAFALLVGLVLARGDTLRGVNPDVASLYTGTGGMFTCISGLSKTIPFSRVNDDYCDCPDGSDEPGTSACHNGRFYCQNLGHEPSLLASAFVDDGICDCCDGTDETKGKCQNTCLQASAVRKEALRSKIQLHEYALGMKANYIERARSFKEELRLKAGTIDADIAQQQAEVNRLREEATRVEEEELAARSLAGEEAAEGTADDSAGEEADADEHDEFVPAAEGHEERELREDSQEGLHEEREETAEERGRRIASQWTNDPDAAAIPESEGDVNGDDSQDEDAPYDGEDNRGDYDRGHDLPPREQTPEGAPAAADGQRELSAPSEWDDLMMFVGLVKHWAARWIDTFANVWSQGIRGEVLEYREKRSANYAARLRQRAEKEAHREQSRQTKRRHSVAAPSTSSSSPATSEERQSPASLARARVYDAEKLLESLRKDKQNMETYLHRGLDFGPNDMFLAFADKCFSSYQTRWTYEVCVFQDAIQKEGHTNSVTIGRWYGFSDDYKQMLFTGGDECWNVGPRSMTVSLSCGLDERLTDGEEPATCAYAAKLETPVACTDSELEELHQQLRNLEEFEKEVQAKLAKDEL